MASPNVQAKNWLSDEEREEAHNELEETNITSGNIKDHEAVIFSYNNFCIHYNFEVQIYKFGLCPCFECVCERKMHPTPADDPVRLY